MRALILDSGNTSSYHAMRSLAQAGHDVHLMSADDSIGLRSKYCGKVIVIADRIDPESYWDLLLEQLRARRYDLLMFCGDREAEIVWNHRRELQPLVTVCLAPEDVRPIVFSKHAAQQHVAALGLPVPLMGFPESESETARIATEMGFPIVVKGEHGSGAARVRYAFSAEEAAEHYRNIAGLERDDGGRCSVQEYIGGPGYVVHALLWHGTPMAVCAHRKDREYPMTGGVTSAATTVAVPAATDAALRILQSLRWHGLAKIDFKYDQRDGTYRFIELDGRISASIDITRVAGVDQTRMLADLVAGKAPRPCLDYRVGVRYQWLFPRDVVTWLAEPWHLATTLTGLSRPHRHLDLDIWDIGPTLRAGRLMLYYLKTQAQTRAVWRQKRLANRLRSHPLAWAPRVQPSVLSALARRTT